MRFGECMKKLRMEKGFSLRKLAKELKLSAPYLSDVERGQRKPLSEEYLEKLCKVLELDETQRQDLFDSAAETKGLPIPSDVAEYTGNVKSIAIALRRARDLDLGEEEWLRIIEEMEKGQK